LGIELVEIEFLQHNPCLAGHGLDIEFLIEARGCEQLQKLSGVLR
jgi:hypothetical protein